MTATVSAPIINSKTGQDFLKSTSFSISQDDCMTRQKMDSIFKSDYPPYSHYGRPGLADRPPLAEVMHRDQKFFHERQSETTNSFEHRPAPKPELQGVGGKLRVTNFKMDRDLSKCNTFETVHNSYFTPKMDDNYKRLESYGTQRSYIPQGDKEKEPRPLTDYRDRFQGHDTRVHKTIRAPSMHEGGPPTIKGDGRSTHYNTHHTDTFLGRYEKPVSTLPVPPSYNVPVGDPDKIIDRETTMNASYQDTSGQNENHRYSLEEVSKVLNQTNFKQSDGHYRWNDYISTASKSFQPSNTPVDRLNPANYRNHSDFPGGDLDPARVTDRASVTTNRFHYGDGHRGSQNTIISGANLRTKSNVWFGEPPLGGTFYETTNADTFPAKTVPFDYYRGKYYKESDIPVNYYGKHGRSHTTAYTDYQNPRQPKLSMDADALDNLKKSHILPPLSKGGYFNTTHNDMFTPKSSDKYTYDSGRLQKSSVPLGTMGPKVI